MLSGETAAGAHPVEAVATMAEICRKSEQYLEEFDKVFDDGDFVDVSDTTGSAAVIAARAWGTPQFWPFVAALPFLWSVMAVHMLLSTVMSGELKEANDDQERLIAELAAMRDEAEAANAAKKGEAEALYEEWKSAGATEEAFIELAKEHSADSNAAQGGIYTGVFQGQMVTEFNDWCFDESRKPGDHGIVETSYGYHLMYFVENEGLSYRGDIKDALQAEQYNEYLNGLKETSSTTYNAKALNLM
jgi:hypothetical protein